VFTDGWRQCQVFTGLTSYSDSFLSTGLDCILYDHVPTDYRILYDHVPTDYRIPIATERLTVAVKRKASFLCEGGGGGFRLTSV
jgi:hypothetical protein